MAQDKRQVDVLTQTDYEIFALGAKNLNYITDYYFRTPDGGTRWRKNPIPYDEDRVQGWRNLYAKWIEQDRPYPTWEHNEIEYKIQEDENGDPIFWHHHGWLAIPWQQELHHSSQPEATVIAGYGSGKTAYEATAACVLAMTIPNCRIFCIAPQMLQGMEVYKYIYNNFQNTPFWNRFVWNYPQKPYPKFVIRNDYIQESTIEILSVEDDPSKIRTLEGDIMFLDQAEKIQELDALMRDAGSRLRGQVQGRSRLGRFIMFANSADNDELFYRFGLGEHEPKIYKSMKIATWDNPYITKSQLEDLKRRVGGTQADIDQWLGGERPPGPGKHFTKETVHDCHAIDLDNVMDTNIKRINDFREIEESKKRKGVPFISHLSDVEGYGKYIKETAPKIGVYHWEMFPDHEGGRQYIVIADPGQSNPPDRNSAPIMVWDITDFPQKPATLRAFHWVFCNGSYWPFLNEYERMVKVYRAQGRNGFDSTGTQKGFDELVFSMMNLHPEGLNLAGTGKFLALNSLKMFMGKRLMVYPYIGHLFNQLTNYELPDNKLKQDLVMCMAMSAMYIRRYFWMEAEDEIEGIEKKPLSYDRYKRPINNRDRREARR